MKYYKNENNELFVDPIVEKHNGLVEITESEFKVQLEINNTPTPEEVIAQEVAEKKAYLDSTDHKMLNGYVLKDGEDLDAIIVVRNEAREFIRANEV